MAFLRKKKAEEGQEKPKKSQLRDWTEALIVAAILALIIRTFAVQAFKIPSGSMLDTLLIGDHLLVNKFIYGTQIPFVSDERYIALRCCAPLLRLLLKDVENVDGTAEADRVDAPVRPTVMVFHDLENTGASESFEGLR